MFTRTLSAGAAAGLGEVAPAKLGAVLAGTDVLQPNSAQCLRAASTAGALLAGYFPHLRGAFRFPPHLAAKPSGRNFGDAPQLSPQIASLLSQEMPVEQAVWDMKYSDKVDAPLLDEPSAPAVDVEQVRASVVATLMAREYGPRMGRLEQRCLSLQASNQQLQANSEQSNTRSEKTRELNRRLCREMTDARSERNSAFEELDRLKQLLNLSRQQVEQVRCENSTLTEALQASQVQVLELSSETAEKPSHVVDLLQKSTTSDDKCGRVHVLEAELHPTSLTEPDSQEQLRFGDGACRCNDKTSWGCDLHQVYSGSLLLAHRQTTSRISCGPPGLELEAPPGLEFKFTEGALPPWGSALRMAPS